MKRKIGNTFLTKGRVHMLYFLVCVLWLSFPLQTYAKTAPSLPQKVTVCVGEKRKLTITPQTQSAKWKSHSPSIVSVNQKGIITAKRKGSAIITATVSKKTLSCTVTVENVKLNKTTLSLKKGGSYQLKLTGTKRKANWKSSKSTVVSVSKNGLVKAKKNGSSTITATLGKKSFSCKIKVTTTQTTGLSLSETSISLIPGGQKLLKAKKGSALSGKRVTWTSSNPAIAFVDNSGNVIGAQSGTAVITASCGGKTASCFVRVKGTGTVSGTIYSDYNDVFLWRNDTGARVILIPTDGSAKKLKISAALYWDVNANRSLLEPYGVYCTSVDTFGRFLINNVPEGEYLIIVSSAWSRHANKESTTFKYTSKTYHINTPRERLEKVIAPYTSASLGETIKEWGKGRRTVGDIRALTSNGNIVFNYQFPATGRVF